MWWILLVIFMIFVLFTKPDPDDSDYVDPVEELLSGTNAEFPPIIALLMIPVVLVLGIAIIWVLL